MEVKSIILDDVRTSLICRHWKLSPSIIGISATLQADRFVAAS